MTASPMRTRMIAAPAPDASMTVSYGGRASVTARNGGMARGAGGGGAEDEGLAGASAREEVKSRGVARSLMKDTRGVEDPRTPRGLGSGGVSARDVGERSWGERARNGESSSESTWHPSTVTDGVAGERRGGRGAGTPQPPHSARYEKSKVWGDKEAGNGGPRDNGISSPDTLGDAVANAGVAGVENGGSQRGEGGGAGALRGQLSGGSRERDARKLASMRGPRSHDDGHHGCVGGGGVGGALSSSRSLGVGGGGDSARSAGASERSSDLSARELRQKQVCLGVGGW